MIQTKTYLKEKFSAGKMPVTQDYQDLIDSLYGNIEMIKTSLDSIDWETDDEFVPTAKAIYQQYADTIEAIQDIIVRTAAVEQRVADFEARIKEYVDVDWDSDTDIPTASAVKQYIDNYTDNLVLSLTDGCLYVD